MASRNYRIISLAEDVRTVHKKGQNGWGIALSTLRGIQYKGLAQKYETNQGMKWSPGSSVSTVMDYGSEVRDILDLFSA